jgi:glycerol-3-phosphate acyltransferase PlsY
MVLVELLELIAALACGYILGSIPTSIIVGRLYGGVDIRRFGSGNPGTTNVIRQLGWGPGAAVFLVDSAKGYLAVLLVGLLNLDPFAWGNDSARAVAGAGAVAGHIWTLFAGFRGGKGVATAFGALLALQAGAAFICALIFASTVLLTRIVSLASLVSAASMAPALLLLGLMTEEGWNGSTIAFSIAAAAMIIYAHRSNIDRLASGTESRFRPPGGDP